MPDDRRLTPGAALAARVGLGAGSALMHQEVS
jgi:hypothetical protein